MIVNSANLASLRQGYHAAFNKQLTETKTYYQEIATVIPSSTAIQTYGWLGQFPQFREWLGERVIHNLEEVGYSVENKHFEMTIGVRRDAIEDDTYGVYTPMMAAMGQSGAELPDDLVFTQLQKGFKESCYDGKPFFSDKHMVGKKTFSNLSKKKLSEASYAAGRAAMQSLTGENNKPLGLIPNLLVVSPTNEAAARRILLADQIEGTSNVWKGSAKLLVVPKLAGNPDFWFLMDTARFLKPLIYQDRKKVRFVSKVNENDDNVFMRDEYLYGADGRGAAGFGFWQMAYGSTGEEA